MSMIQMESVCSVKTGLISIKEIAFFLLKFNRFFKDLPNYQQFSMREEVFISLQLPRPLQLLQLELMDSLLIIALEDSEALAEDLEEEILVDLVLVLEALDLVIQDLEVWASEVMVDSDQPQHLTLEVLLQQQMDLVGVQALKQDLDQEVPQQVLVQLVTPILQALLQQILALEEQQTALDQTPTLIQGQVVQEVQVDLASEVRAAA